MSLPADILDARPHPVWDTRRLWSLADMIQSYIYNFIYGRQQLWQAITQANAEAANDRSAVVPPSVFPRIKNEIEAAIKHCAVALKLERANYTCVDLENLIYNHEYQPVRWGRLDELLRRFWEEIEWDTVSVSFFHYPKEIARLRIGASDEWGPCLAEYSSAKREIEAGIDCYAFDDPAGCVFHMMRIAEMGLREIARELKIRSVKRSKPIEYAMWGEIIGALQKAVDDLRIAKGNTKPLTAVQREKREKRIERYSLILSDMQALLPLRDRNSHYRNKYDPGEAFTAMTRVREMMNLAAGRA
jgi:hypothetical protein